MRHQNLLKFGLLAAIASQLVFAQNNKNSRENWVTTWAASMLATNVPAGPPPGTNAPAPAVAPAPAPAAPNGQPAVAPPKPQPLRNFNNQTVRMFVRTSIGGRRVR